MSKTPPGSLVADAATDVAAPPADDGRVPGENELLRVDGQTLRMVGTLAASGRAADQRRLVLLPPGLAFSPFLVAAHGDLSLPTVADWRRLVASGRAEFIDATAHGAVAGGPEDDADRIAFQCDLLDRAAVPNGWKSIAIWLHQHWTGGLEERWGPHDSPHTLRRWRSRRRASSAGSFR